MRVVGNFNKRRSNKMIQKIINKSLELKNSLNQNVVNKTDVNENAAAVKATP